MRPMAKKWVLILGSPLVTAMLLGAIALENARHVKPENVEPFHEAAKAAIASLPYTMGSWAGSDMEVPPEAVKLLKPNIILSRKYVNYSKVNQWVSLLIVQCRDSRDMVGHYPPVCYPGQGEEMVSQRDLTISVAGLTVPVREYLFQRSIADQVAKRYVYNFLAVPGAGLIRDMEGVYRAAEDYQRRYYGAAQVQVLMPVDIEEAAREGILRTFFGANAGLIRLLRDGELK